MTRTVVAIGGGGFLYGDRFRALDDYVLEVTGRDNPRICFLPTPCGDHPEFIEKFYEAFAGRGRLSHATLFITRGTEARPQAHLLDQDLIYVSSGNSVSGLAVWRAHGIDRVLAEAWRRGTVMAGVSAGGVCWFDESITDATTETPTAVAGLALIPGIVAAHVNVLPDREAVLREKLTSMATPAVGYALDDGVALRFDDKLLSEGVSCQDGRRVRRLETRGAGTLAESAVAIRDLVRSDDRC